MRAKLEGQWRSHAHTDALTHHPLPASLSSPRRAWGCRAASGPGHAARGEGVNPFCLLTAGERGCGHGLGGQWGSPPRRTASSNREPPRVQPGSGRDRAGLRRQRSAQSLRRPQSTGVGYATPLPLETGEQGPRGVCAHGEAPMGCSRQRLSGSRSVIRVAKRSGGKGRRG